MLLHCFDIIGHFVVLMDIGLTRLLIGLYHLPSLQETVMSVATAKIMVLHQGTFTHKSDFALSLQVY